MLRYDSPAQTSPATDSKDTLANASHDIPIVLVSGFLGAGKTRFLSRALSQPKLSGTLLIVNEFGALGIDDALLAGHAGETLLLENGCLCCALSGDLIALLGERLRLAALSEAPKFQRVVIETSGIADLQKLLESVVYTTRQHPHYRLGRVLVLVDGLQGGDILAHETLAAEQLAFAEHVAITKLDLAPHPDAAQSALIPMLQGLALQASIVPLPQDEAGAADLLLTMCEDGAALPPTAHVSPPPNFVALATAHARYDSFVLRDQVAVSLPALDQFFECLTMAHGKDLLRVKGFVLCGDHLLEPLLIQGVGRSFASPQRFDIWPKSFCETALVFIIRGDLTPAIIKGYWDGLTHDIGIDQPDKAALENNPLKMSSGGLL